MNSDERERLQQAPERLWIDAQIITTPSMRVLYGEPPPDGVRSVEYVRADLLDNQAAGDLQPLTGVIAEIAAREGVLDGWHEEVVLLTPDERDDLAREWRALQEQINKFRQQFELLDDPQGLYSATKSEVENSAATRMRDKCVDAIKSLRSTPHGAAYNNAVNDAIAKVSSLTLDNGDTDEQPNG